MRVLRNRRFALLLAGQGVNAIGNWIAIIAVWGFAAFEFDAGAGDLALLFVVLSVPGAFFGPLLGVVIDRVGPRRALVVANVVGFLNALALTQADSYLQIVLFALPLGIVEALANASLDAIPPRLVDDEDLVSANALLGGAQDFAIIAGPVLAAGVNVRWGLEGAFLADALTFLVGLAVALPLDIPPVEREEPESAWRELRAGLRLARRTDGLRWTLSVAGLTYLLWAVFGVLEPLYVRDVLADSDTTFALLQTVWGVGLVGTGLLLAVIGDRFAKPRYVAIATIVSGGAAALYLGTESLAVAYVGVFIWGVDVAFFFVPAKTLLQRYTPTEAHGRILALNESLEPLAGIVMTPAIAGLVGYVGVRQLGIAAGAVAAIAALVALRLARGLAPPPVRRRDPTAGSSKEAIALGGTAPG